MRTVDSTLNSSEGCARASSPAYSYRPCNTQDFDQLKQAHLLLPVDYQDSFFFDVVESKEPFFSFCCIAEIGLGDLVGFVTAKLLPLVEVPHNDLQCLKWALKDSADESQQAAYILTIGVYPAHQRNGIASKLLSMVSQV
jgi:ribosomal protein S18 acetylase RimI-like enzyme